MISARSRTYFSVLLLPLLMTSLLLTISTASAQEPATGPEPAPPPTTVTSEDMTSEDMTSEDVTTEDITPPGSGEEESLAELIGSSICPAGECCPPSTQEKVMIGVGFLTLLVLLFFLLVRVFERRFIAQDRNSMLGRHLGISLTVVLTALGTAGLAYWLTDCWHSSYWVGLAVLGGAWLIHLIYTLAIVRDS